MVLQRFYCDIFEGLSVITLLLTLAYRDLDFRSNTRVSNSQ